MFSKLQLYLISIYRVLFISILIVHRLSSFDDLVCRSELLAVHCYYIVAIWLVPLQIVMIEVLAVFFNVTSSFLLSCAYVLSCVYCTMRVLRVNKSAV